MSRSFRRLLQLLPILAVALRRSKFLLVLNLLSQSSISPQHSLCYEGMGATSTFDGSVRIFFVVCLMCAHLKVKHLAAGICIYDYRFILLLR